MDDLPKPNDGKIHQSYANDFGSFLNKVIVSSNGFTNPCIETFRNMIYIALRINENEIDEDGVFLVDMKDFIDINGLKDKVVHEISSRCDEFKKTGEVAQ